MLNRMTALAAACGMLSCSTVEARNSTRWLMPDDSATHSVALTEVEEPQAQIKSTWSWLNALRGDTYPLDDVDRRIEPRLRVVCDAKTLVQYTGTELKYAGGVLIAPAFAHRLTRFEAIVNRVAEEAYGRKPTRLVHAGAYACRPSRNRSSRLSEHALGNALDVVGLSFNGLSKTTSKAQREATPAFMRGPFKVTVAEHWNATRSEAGRLHRQFIRKLADEVARADVFRVVLGPGHPGHGDHLHFDMSPWHYTHL